jgi:hypothetical protein
MATTTYTSKLRLSKPTTGELFGTWGNEVNSGITNGVDDAIAGRVVVTHNNNANYTLTANNGAADEARNAVLRITGTLTAARNVVCPTQPKLYIVENATTGGFAITLKTLAGSGVSVANGAAAMLRCDGTDVVEWIPVTGTGSLVKAASPTLVTPALGTPSAVVLTNATGTAAGLTAGIAQALKSATTTVDVSAAAAPTTGQVLVATGGSAATWQDGTALTSGSTNALRSATTTVNVSSATAPVAGQVLMATSSTAATWQVVGAGSIYSNTVNVFTKNQSVLPVALTAGATVNVDASLSNNFTLTPDQNFTLAEPTNATDGMVCNFVFTQPATPRTITFASAYQFAGGTEPTLTASANAVDFMSAYYNGATSKWICVMNKDFKA